MDNKTIKVWDLFVRVFHWSLVFSVVVALVTAEELEGVHAAIGYLIAGLLLARFVWGFVGTRHARFSDFIYGPTEVFSYLGGLLKGRARRYIGHNPAGGWMIVILLVMLSVTVATGYKAYGLENAAGTHDSLFVSSAHADEGERYSEHGEEGGEKEGFWEEVHEGFAHATIILIGIHIAGVLVSSYLHRENLVKAMITGNKEAAQG